MTAFFKRLFLFLFSGKSNTSLTCKRKKETEIGMAANIPVVTLDCEAGEGPYGIELRQASQRLTADINDLDAIMPPDDIEESEEEPSEGESTDEIETIEEDSESAEEAIEGESENETIEDDSEAAEEAIEGESETDEEMYGNEVEVGNNIYMYDGFMYNANDPASLDDRNLVRMTKWSHAKQEQMHLAQVNGLTEFYHRKIAYFKERLKNIYVTIFFKALVRKVLKSHKYYLEMDITPANEARAADYKKLIEKCILYLYFKHKDYKLQVTNRYFNSRRGIKDYVNHNHGTLCPTKCRDMVIRYFLLDMWLRDQNITLEASGRLKSCYRIDQYEFHVCNRGNIIERKRNGPRLTCGCKFTAMCEFVGK